MGNNFEEYRSALATIDHDVGELWPKVAAIDQFPAQHLEHLYLCLRAYNHDSRSLRRSYNHDALANHYRDTWKSHVYIH